MADIFGTEGNDVLIGTDADFLGSGGGDDNIYGRGGNDRINGLGGKNLLDGGVGDDRFLITVAPHENSSIYTSLWGGAGYDTLDLSGSPVAVSLTRSSGMGFARTNFYGSGLNATWDASVEHIVGSRFDDRLSVVYALDINGGDGNDTIMTGPGISQGFDRFDTGKYDSTLRGGAGDDVLQSSAATIRLYGDDGNDRLFAENGPDGQLFGGAGNDSLMALRGGLLDGGEGTDTLEATFYQTADLATGRMVNNDGTAATATLVSIENILVGVNNSDTRFVGTAYGNDNANMLTTYMSSPSRLYGRGGHDILNGGNGNDLLDGGDGDDILSPEAGNNIVTGGSGTDSVNIPFRFSDSQFTFNLAFTDITGRHYLIADSFTNRVDGVEIYRFREVTINNADGNRLVDDLYYLANNRDVVADDAEGHWSAFGWREQRDPNAFFDTSAYVGANPSAGNGDPLAHYLENGVRTGRDPSLLFDNEQYLAKNSDVAAGGMNPFFHYVAFGQAEQRAIYSAVGSGINGDFDAQFYLLANTDVAKSGMDPLSHYRQFGWREGRDPNAYFDTGYYKQNNPDVLTDPLAHYGEFGWREGRDPSAAFDTSAYLSAYDDVAASGMDPLMHFLVWGRLDGHDAFAV
ncbi:MAG: calcium-binding protein [Sphingobium sp.]